MSKIYDTTKDNLILSNLYYKKLESGDYDGALGIIRRLESQKIDKESLYFYYAKTYYKANLYHESINNWFKFLSVCKEKKQTFAYNGLGACFYKLGDNNKASLYFNMQLSLKPKEPYPYDDVLKEFFEEVTDVKRVYTLAYPYEKADFTPLLEKCYDLTKASRHKEVLNELKVIPKTSKYYGQAVMQKAICHFFLDENAKAVEYAILAVELEPKNVNAICNAISILNACNLREDAQKYVKIVKEISAEISVEDTVKAIMVLSDFGEYEFAKNIAYNYLSKVKTDVHVFYILGIVEYNLKNFEKAKELFLKSYRYTLSYVSKYYAKLCDVAIKKQNANKKVKKLNFDYDLPDDEKFKILEKLAKLSSKKVKELSQDLKEICEYCFYTTSEKMAFLAMQILLDINTKKSIEFLKEKLLSLGVFDSFKKAIISCFIIDGQKGELSVVLSGRFKKIKLLNVDFYGDNATVFKNAYAYLIAETCLITSEYEKLKQSALDVYGALVFTGNENNITDHKALAALMFELSGVVKKVNKTELASFFNTSTKQVKKVRDLYLLAFKEEPLIEENTKKIIEEIYNE